jgi:hypothetical protein
VGLRSRNTPNQGMQLILSESALLRTLVHDIHSFGAVSSRALSDSKHRERLNWKWPTERTDQEEEETLTFVLAAPSLMMADRQVAAACTMLYRAYMLAQGILYN